VICFVCLTMKPVGEPDAGNPHVRFDERGWETERCRMPKLPRPSSTLPQRRSPSGSANSRNRRYCGPLSPGGRSARSFDGIGADRGGVNQTCSSSLAVLTEDEIAAVGKISLPTMRGPNRRRVHAAAMSSSVSSSGLSTMMSWPQSMLCVCQVGSALHCASHLSKLGSE
jgi:hypothetical protein